MRENREIGDEENDRGDFGRAGGGNAGRRGKRMIMKALSNAFSEREGFVEAERRLVVDLLRLLGEEKARQMKKIVVCGYICGVSCKRLTKEEKFGYGGCVRECLALCKAQKSFVCCGGEEVLVNLRNGVMFEENCMG